MSKFNRLKTLANDNFTILFHGLEFDSYSSQEFIIDSLVSISNEQLLTQGVIDIPVREEAVTEIRSFEKQRIGIVYFNEDQNDLFGMDILYNEGFDELGGDPVYNGSISGIKWQSSNFSGEQGYGFQYDNANRMKDANYGSKTDNLWVATNRYSVYGIQYDKNGNITSLNRKGLFDANRSQNPYDDIDQLSYSYDGNQLASVDDEIVDNLTTNDFKDYGSYSANEYLYDVNGRLIKDDNKSITNISYNYLNLPSEINFGPNAKINYVYDASGRKLTKKLYHGPAQENTDYTHYINGFIYKNKALESVNFDIGRLLKKQDGTFRYEYFYKDHLGNVRCSFTDLQDDGVAETVQEDHYYPFGMTIDGLSFRDNLENNLLFQGKERQSDAIDIDNDGTSDRRFLWYDFSARYYDPQIGRWHVPDPADQYYSPYLAMGNNPVSKIDPDGLRAIGWKSASELEMEQYLDFLHNEWARDFGNMNDYLKQKSSLDAMNPEKLDYGGGNSNVNNGDTQPEQTGGGDEDEDEGKGDGNDGGGNDGGGNDGDSNDGDSNDGDGNEGDGRTADEIRNDQLKEFYKNQFLSHPFTRRGFNAGINYLIGADFEQAFVDAAEKPLQFFAKCIPPVLAANGVSLMASEDNTSMFGESSQHPYLEGSLMIFTSVLPFSEWSLFISASSEIAKEVD